MRLDPRSIWTWLSLLVLGLLCLFLVYPVANIFLASLGGPGRGDGWTIIVSDPRYPRAIANTLVLGVAVTVAAMSIGVPLAYLTARYDFPGKAIVSILPLVTLVAPEVIVAQTWLMMLGNNGLIRRWLTEYGVVLPSFYGWFGLITSMTFVYYTYAYIGTLAAIRGFDVQLEEAARSLGSSPVRARLRVLVPVVLPAILASALLVFTLVVGNFALSMILGGRVELLSVKTYQAAVSETSSNPVLQSTLASVSISIVMILLFAQRWIVSRGRFEIVQGRQAKAQLLRGLPALAFAALAALVVAISLLPLAAVVAGAFTMSRGPVMRWGQWTTANLERVLSRSPEPLYNTLTYAGTATAIAIALSGLIGYLIVRRRNAVTPLIDYVTALPLALSADAVLAWVTALAELSTSIIVYSGGRETIPIQIFKLIEGGLMAQASAYGLVLVCVILVPILVATRIFRIDLFASRS